MNKLITGDNISVLKRFPDNSVDLVFTSPPYDSQRTYKGFPPVDFIALGHELYRVIKPNAPIVFVIQDGIHRKRRTATTARLIVDMVDTCGLHLWECFIAHKTSTIPVKKEGAVRCKTDHEFVPIFTKGDNENIKTFNVPEVNIRWLNTYKEANIVDRLGNRKLQKIHSTAKTRVKGTIWNYAPSAVYANRLKYKHPAVFPNQFARDFIETFTNPGDLVLDPFSGSGTTAIEAYKLYRFYAGIDISKEYTAIASELIGEIPRRRYEFELDTSTI